MSAVYSYSQGCILIVIFQIHIELLDPIDLHQVVQALDRASLCHVVQDSFTITVLDVRVKLIFSAFVYKQL